MNTELKERLANLEERLKERGTVDVKFHLHDTEATTDKVAADVADMLEAMLDGKVKPWFGFGDSTNPATIEHFAKQRREYEAVHGPLND